MRRLIKIILTLIVILAIAYLSQSLYLSFKTNYLINLAYDTNGKYSEKLKNTISKDIFERLNYRKGWRKGTGTIVEEHYSSFPITYLMLGTACSRYYYAYKKIDSEQGVIGSTPKTPVTITWKLKNWKWIITEKYEVP